MIAGGHAPIQMHFTGRTPLLELLDRIGQLNGRAIPTTYDPTPRVGDHICYITKLAKLRSHYPGWDLTYNLDDIVESVYTAATRALQSQPAE